MWYFLKGPVFLLFFVNFIAVEAIEQRSKLDLRFPRELWEEAKLYFTEPQQN